MVGTNIEGRYTSKDRKNNSFDENVLDVTYPNLLWMPPGSRWMRDPVGTNQKRASIRCEHSPLTTNQKRKSIY